MESDELGFCFARQYFPLSDAMLTNFIVMGFLYLLQKSHAWGLGSWTFPFPD